MKKIKISKFIYLVVLSLVSLFIASCSKEAEKDIKPEITKANKTIFVYMPWTDSRYSNINSLHDNFVQNIADIEQAIKEQQGLKNSRLIVFIDSLAPRNGMMFEIKYNNGEISKTLIKKYDESAPPRYTTEEGLTELLNDVKQVAPANIYSLIIGSHGVGWIPKNSTALSRTRFFGGSTPEYQTNIETLKNSLQRANMKMQYIMFDDCYMSNIETAYELRDVTNYLIGCTSEIMAYGMPYHLMWKELESENPNYQNIVNIFYNFYNNYSTPCGAIGISDCSKTQQLANIMKEINSRYSFNTSDNYMVQKLDGYRETIFYDMKSYVDLLCKDETLKKEFNDVLLQVTPYFATTKQIYTDLRQLSYRFINVDTFSGITISDNTTATAYGVNSTKQTTSWWKATH